MSSLNSFSIPSRLRALATTVTTWALSHLETELAPLGFVSCLLAYLVTQQGKTLHRVPCESVVALIYKTIVLVEEVLYKHQYRGKRECEWDLSVWRCSLNRWFHLGTVESLWHGQGTASCFQLLRSNLCSRQLSNISLQSNWSGLSWWSLGAVDQGHLKVQYES